MPKVKNTSREDPSTDEEQIDDRKRARVDADELPPTPPNSQESTHELYPWDAIPGPSNDGLSTLPSTPDDSLSYSLAAPNNPFLGRKRITAAQRRDLLNEPTSPDIEQGLSEKLSVKPAVNQAKTNEANSKSSKVMELRQQVEELRNKLNKTLLEVEKAKTDRDEIVEFMTQGYINASRDAYKSENQLQAYKKLVAQKFPNMNLETLQQNVKFKITEKEARLIALISVFLSVHQTGAHIDYICCYLENIDPEVNARDVETLMRHFPNVFQEITTGIGPNVRKFWKYLGLKRS